MVYIGSVAQGWPQRRASLKPRFFAYVCGLGPPSLPLSEVHGASELSPRLSGGLLGPSSVVNLAMANLDMGPSGPVEDVRFVFKHQHFDGVQSSRHDAGRSVACRTTGTEG